MISVVVPAYNAATTLDGCLRSIRNQSLGDGESLEVIVVDNASTDRTAEVARRWSARVLTEPTPGPAAARNRGLGEAGGEWIAFIDADCEIPGGWIETACAVLRREPKAAAAGGPGRIPGDGWLARCLNGLHYGLSARTGPRRVRSLATMNVLFRGRVIRGYRFDPRYLMGEDPELNLRLVRDGWTLLFDPSLAVVHHHPTTMPGIMRKWFEYGLHYPQPYFGHRQWLFESGLLPRLLYLPLVAACIVGGLFEPWCLLAAILLVLALPAAYLIVGWRAVHGWDRLRFPGLHTMKQWAQLAGILVGWIRPGRRLARSRRQVGAAQVEEEGG